MKPDTEIEVVDACRGPIIEYGEDWTDEWYWVKAKQKQDQTDKFNKWQSHSPYAKCPNGFNNCLVFSGGGFRSFY